MEILRKAVLASIGIAHLTREKVEEVGKKISADTNVSVEEGKKFVEELVHKTEDARKGLEKSIQDGVAKTLAGMNIPGKAQIDALEKRIAELEKLVKG